MSICHQTEDAGVGKSGFIEPLKEVDCKHDGEDGEIDLPLDTIVLLRGDDDSVASMLNKFSSFVFACKVFTTLAIVLGNMFDRLELLVVDIVVQL